MNRKQKCELFKKLVNHQTVIVADLHNALLNLKQDQLAVLESMNQTYPDADCDSTLATNFFKKRDSLAFMKGADAAKERAMITFRNRCNYQEKLYQEEKEILIVLQKKHDCFSRLRK
jgi:hypothetical protein